jgi:hypothetical protein
MNYRNASASDITRGVALISKREHLFDRLQKRGWLAASTATCQLEQLCIKAGVLPCCPWAIAALPMLDREPSCLCLALPPRNSAGRFATLIPIRKPL